MDYWQWIRRERRIRSKLLRDSLVVRESGRCRICKDCQEICLCHEEICPNCGGRNVRQERLANIVAELAGGERIRCKARFDQLR
jgi:hypothetical protein